MVKLDPMAILMFVIRMSPAILFILFIMLIFFSFQVDVRNDNMKRAIFEISDSLTSSQLTDYKSVFNPQKLTDAEKTDPNRNIELYAINCDYGYSLDIESVAGNTRCGSGSDCVNFCYSVCGLDASTIDMSTVGTINGNCGCNIEVRGINFCECKKSGGSWQDTYKWGYGYVASFKGKIAAPYAEFPVGINVGSVIPAKMKITAYDSFLTRIGCATKKAYELKEVAKIRFDTSYVTRNTVFKRTDPAGTHVCLYFPPDTSYDCRYFPDVPFLDFTFQPPFGKDNGIIAAYPLKVSFATCGDITSDPSLIATGNDPVVTVILCLVNA